MGTKRRLLEFIKYLKLGQNAFEKEVGIANGYISHLKESIGSEHVTKIINRFPDLNPEWLLTGDGEMIKSNIQDNSNFQQGQNISYRHEIYPETIAESSKGYQEIIKNSQRQIDEFQKMFLIQQEQMNRLLELFKNLKKI